VPSAPDPPCSTSAVAVELTAVSRAAVRPCTTPREDAFPAAATLATGPATAGGRVKFAGTVMRKVVLPLTAGMMSGGAIEVSWRTALPPFTDGDDELPAWISVPPLLDVDDPPN